jgi:predicted GTPase
MQNLPMIAICGRPNVGKSTLFNVLAKKRIAIVDPTPGVTRDRIIREIALGDNRCQLVDTGGLGIDDESKLGGVIAEQACKAIEQASIVLFLVDIQSGLHPLDMEVSELLKKKIQPKKSIFGCEQSGHKPMGHGKGSISQIGMEKFFLHFLCSSPRHWRFKRKARS